MRAQLSSKEAGRVCMVCSLEEHVSLRHPLSEDDGIDLADSLTCTVVVGSGPLGLSISGICLDVGHVAPDGLEEFELPVGVGPGGLDGILLRGVSIIDGLVLGIGVADCSVHDSLWLQFGDGALHGGPVVGRQGSDESIGVVSQVLVWLEAGAELSSKIGVGWEECVEESSLESGGGSVWNSVLSSVDSEGESSEHLLRFKK